MNKIQTITLGLLLTASMTGFCSQCAPAEEEKTPDYIMDTSSIGNSENGYIRSEQLLELGSPTPSALSIEGEQSLRQGSIDRALTVLQRSVEMAPLDIDSRILYAQTLEKKLMMEKDKKDPKLFNFCIKQWYCVYKKAEFLDQTMLGLSHVVELTGTQPKRFENAQKFFARVLLPEDGSVKVVIGGNNKPKISKKKVDKDDMQFNSELTQSKSGVPQ